MKRAQSRPQRWRIVWLVAGLVLASAHSAHAQLSTQEEERLRMLSDPDAIKKKIDEKKDRLPFEFFKSQIAPFDILPFIKSHHWSTLTLDMRANEADYDGFLQTDPVDLPPMPLNMVFRREARLVKQQRRGLGQQVMLTRIPKEWTLSLVRPNALRGDASWQAILTTLEPHQALIVVLSKESATQFAPWGRMSAMIPSGTDREDTRMLDRQRYYRLVLPTEPDKLALSPHPLTWSTISHVIWDGMPPDNLSVSQQQALLDWLHWGGQLIFTGGAGQSYALYKESFLGPYLPGEPTGQTVPLTEADLKPLSQSYPPPFTSQLPTGEDFSTVQRFSRLAADRVGLPGSRAAPAAQQQAGVSLGPEAGRGVFDDPAGRSQPAPAGGRAPGRTRADHHADHQPGRAGAGHLAGPGYDGPPRDPPPARGGREGDGRLQLRQLPGSAARVPRRAGPHLVPDHQPGRPPARG